MSQSVIMMSVLNYLELGHQICGWGTKRRNNSRRPRNLRAQVRCREPACSSRQHSMENRQVGFISALPFRLSTDQNISQLQRKDILSNKAEPDIHCKELSQVEEG